MRTGSCEAAVSTPLRHTQSWLCGHSRASHVLPGVPPSRRGRVTRPAPFALACEPHREASRSSLPVDGWVSTSFAATANFMRI